MFSDEFKKRNDRLYNNNGKSKAILVTKYELIVSSVLSWNRQYYNSGTFNVIIIRRYEDKQIKIENGI